MIYLEQNAIIPESKLTKYLLIKLLKDDKSEFLAKAGYTLDIVIPIKIRTVKK